MIFIAFQHKLERKSLRNCNISLENYHRYWLKPQSTIKGEYLTACTDFLQPSSEDCAGKLGSKCRKSHFTRQSTANWTCVVTVDIQFIATCNASGMALKDEFTCPLFSLA